jgi:hypothetical protein
MSKWFYYTFPGTATRAARRGSLIGGTKALHAQAKMNPVVYVVRTVRA